MDRADKVFLSGLAIFFVTVVATLVWIVVSEQSNYERRMLDCQRDGKAEYECHSMLRSMGTTFIPVFVR